MRRVAVVLGVALLGACSLFAPPFQRPQLSVDSVRLVGGNLLKQSFLVTFDIENPNDRELPVSRLRADLDVAGTRLASGTSNQPFVVPAHGSSTFDMTITANLAAALLQLGQRSDLHSNAIDYEVTGTASIDLPFLRDLPFHQHGTFALK